MVKEITKLPVNSAESSEQESLEKIRWSLRQRLCEHMRLLNADLFDELDDFLFDSVPPEKLADGSTRLKLIREFRNKKQLFEEQFLASIDGALQSTLVPRSNEKSSNSRQDLDKSSSSAYQKLEIDLALERMQRKAFKCYGSRIKELGSSDGLAEKTVTDQIIPENRDILIKNSLRALAVSHDVFRIPLESRLVFFKLFEKHFLMKMDKLYQEVINIINNKDNQKFVERLYSSSTSIYKRREKSKISQAVAEPDARAEFPEDNFATGSRQIAARIERLIDAWSTETDLPEFVENMLRNDWHGVMFLMGLNKGMETREWCEAKETIDRLVTLIAGKSEPGEKNRNIDWVRQHLRQGFDLAQKTEAEQQEFFTAFEKLIATARGRSEESTSLIFEMNSGGSDQKKSSHFAAVSDAGRKILGHNDLDDFVALLSDDQEQAIAELDEEAISMDYYLNMVDTMADGSEAELLNEDTKGKCSIRKSTSIENSYQVLNEQGNVLLTRGRVGLAVSLRAGEIRLEGQQDFKQGEPGISQIVLSEKTHNTKHVTTH